MTLESVCFNFFGSESKKCEISCKDSCVFSRHFIFTDAPGGPKLLETRGGSGRLVQVTVVFSKENAGARTHGWRRMVSSATNGELWKVTLIKSVRSRIDSFVPLIMAGRRS